MASTHNEANVVPIITPTGEALFPNLVDPDTEFGPVPVYRVKLAVTAEEGKAFFLASRDAFRSSFPGVTPSIIPVRRDRTGRAYILAETLRKPTMHVPNRRIAYVPRHGDHIRLHGALVPFDRDGRRGVNFRVNAVEPVTRDEAR